MCRIFASSATTSDNSDSEISDTWHEGTHNPSLCADCDTCELWPDINFDMSPWPWGASTDSDDSDSTGLAATATTPTRTHFGAAPAGGPSASPQRSAAGPMGILLDTDNSLDRELDRRLAAGIGAMSLGEK